MRRVSAVLCVLLLAAMGCSGDEEPTGEATREEAAETAVTEADAEAEDEATEVVGDDDVEATEDTQDVEEASVEAGEDVTAQVLASATGADGDDALRLDLNAVRRKGKTISITFGVTPTDSKWQVSQFFSGPDREDVESTHTLAGISVIDTANGRRYPVLFDENGECACDSDLSGRFIDAGETGRFSAITGAPPEDVTTVDVQIPGFGTFSDISIES